MKCISEEIAFLINIPTEIYEYGDPDEHRVAAHDNDIPYDWGRKDG
jgi:dTDP-4-dehydrorhamnose 3,5-epimerase